MSNQIFRMLQILIGIPADKFEFSRLMVMQIEFVKKGIVNVNDTCVLRIDYAPYLIRIKLCDSVTICVPTETPCEELHSQTR